MALTHEGWTNQEGISTQFAEMMTDTIVFNAQSAIDKYGKKTFGGSTTTASGRIVFETRLMKDMEGQDIVSTGRVYLYGPYASITLGDKITLPSGATPVIVAVETKKDTGGNHHTVIHFGV
jgi:hypothetical protein